MAEFLRVSEGFTYQGKGVKMRKFYIFDLDGTIADISHRRHMLDDHTDSHRWRRFYDACDLDQPNQPVIDLMHTLALTHDIRIWSGRSDEVIEKTVAWLAKYTHIMTEDAADTLMMRKAGDYTPDDKLKKQWLDGLSVTERGLLAGCFDDRDRIVKMYRENGVMCCQVADGDF
jgi:hypothetical protein